MMCSCCGQPLISRGVQTYPAKYNLPDRHLVECDNAACVMYQRTETDTNHAHACEAEKQKKAKAS
jgi:hypothetical protein